MAKQLSRRKRRDLAVTELNKTVEEARSIAEFLKDKKNQTVAGLRSIKPRLENLGAEPGDLQDLQSEIEEWRGGMPEDLQGGDKYSTLDETANTLESVCSELDGLEIPAFAYQFPEKDTEFDLPTALAELEGLTETLEEFANTVEEQASEADNAEFPGMMG